MPNNIVISGGRETADGIILRVYDSDNNKIIMKPLKFHNYFYIKCDDIEDIKEDFYKKWKGQFLNVEVVNKLFAKIVFLIIKSKLFIQ